MTDMDMPLPEPVACQWLQHGKVVNAFTHPPGDRSKWDYDGYWAKKGYDKAPLFTADQMRERDAAWFKACLSIIDRCVAPDMYGNARALLDKAVIEAMKNG